MLGRCATTSADDPRPLFDESCRSLCEVLGGSIVGDLALYELRKSWRRKGENRQIGRLGDHANKVQHSLRAYDAVRADGHYTTQVGHLGRASSRQSLGQRLPFLDIGLADDDRQVGNTADGIDSDLQLLHVDERLEDKAIDAALGQSGGLLTNAFGALSGRDLSDGLERSTDRANRSED